MPTPFFINASHLLRDNPTQLNYGCAVTDVDGDGRFEIFVAGFGGPCLVLKWTGSQFINIADQTLSNLGRQAIGVAAGDMDGDGLEEIYVLNTDTFGGRKRVGDSLFKWINGRWFDLFTLPDNRDKQNLFAGRSVGAVDRMGDGRYGFFVANYAGPMRFYELMGDSLDLVDVAPELGVNLITGGRAVVPGPILSDAMDIFLNNENGPNFLLKNNGYGTYEEVGEQVGLNDPYEHGRGAALLDANDDGMLDLVCGNWEGPNRLFIRNTAGTFSDIAPPDLAQPSRIRTVIAADFDNDGYDEIFFNNIVQPNRLFGRRGDRWIALNMGDAIEAFGAGTGACVGDFDNNGELKLIISHGESVPQPLSCYKPAPTTHHWLRVLPQTIYGAPARGASVRLYAGGRTQIKAIDAGSGYLCQMEPVAHFGLGPISEIEAIEVRWPGGLVKRLHQPPVDSLIIVQP